MANVKACHKYARISARKVRPFADLIRGMEAGEAMDALKYVHNRGARFLREVLKSAIANADDRDIRNPEALEVVEARVDGGPAYKRLRPAARGAARFIKKRSAHIHVALETPDV
ncbi:50S ribosomal protein L22 [Stratiformator vulcanicus]|uniref:Large ribosomal subunit protein uL22 n=1 Tax=Stratiformator vulcanicus TaxID=2527980 RepID=A0A517R0U4_9PLAN|nr:50S ribosomal protein L22 [Stratiformator vulcanicus]QDT37519.1 50S ribosomal protein L22 [Stratiformator vulcanicus]